MNATSKKLPKPLDFEELFPGRFLKAADLQGKKVTLKITDVDREELEGEDGKEIKVTLSFEKTEKQLILNRTNAEAIRGMFGSKLPAWQGKRITIFEGVVTERGMLKGKACVRVWGSPDIAHDIDLIVKRPRQDEKKMTMHRVVAGGGSKAAPTQTPPADEPREPGDDDR